MQRWDAASADFMYLGPLFNSNARMPAATSCYSAQYRAFQESWAITRLPGFAPTRAKLQIRTPTSLTAPDSVLVWHVIPKKYGRPPPTTLEAAVREVALLGGYLNRSRDGPPGHQTLWKGLERLTTATFVMDMLEHEDD